MSARAKLHDFLFKAQEGTCYLCCDPLGERIIGHDVGYNFDHVWPQARYSFALRGNVMLAHKRCNVAKGDRDPTELELAMLESVNLILGWQTLPQERHRENVVPWEVRVPTAEERAAQSARDKALHAAKQAANPAVPTRRQAEARHPSLWQLDDLIETMRGIYGG